MYLAGDRKLWRDTLNQEEDGINKKKFHQVLSPLPQCEQLQQMSNAFRSLIPYHSIPFHTIPIITQAPPSNALFVVPQRFEVARFPSWDAVGIFQGPSQVPGSQAVPGRPRPAAGQYAFMPSTINMWVPHECGLMTCSKCHANAMQMPCKCHAELQRIVWFSRDNSSLCPVSMKTSQKTNRAQKSSCQNARPYDAA
jgi:hypothetical protein